MPLAFNWQTAAFSVPSLIGYLFPLHLAFTVQVILTLVIAGTGMYALCRVLRLGTLACVFAGTVFELSGPMLGWLGWPHAAVLSWSGWLFAAALLVVRGRHRLRHITLLALVIAAMVYAGQAEVLTLGGLALLVFVVVLLVQRSPGLGGSGPIRRPVLDLSVGVVAGHRPRCSASAARFSGHFGIPAGRPRWRPGGDPEGESRPSLAQPGSRHLPRVRRTASLGQPLVWLHRRILRNGRLRGRDRRGAGRDGRGRSPGPPRGRGLRCPLRCHGGGRLRPAGGGGALPPATDRHGVCGSARSCL